jgi:hypothetical protein
VGDKEIIQQLLARDDVQKRLYAMAIAVIRKRQNARDAIQEATARVLEAQTPWSPPDGVSDAKIVDAFVRHVGGQIRNAHRKLFLRAADRKQDAYDEEDEPLRGAGAHSAEDAAITIESSAEIEARFAAWMAALAARIAADPDEQAILAEHQAGRHRLQEQVEWLKWDIPRTKRVRERLHYRARTIMAEHLAAAREAEERQWSEAQRRDRERKVQA